MVTLFTRESIFNRSTKHKPTILSYLNVLFRFCYKSSFHDYFRLKSSNFVLLYANSFFLTLYKFKEKYFADKIFVHVVSLLRWLKYVFCMEVRGGVVG